MLDSLGLNPTRATLLDVLTALGAHIAVLNLEEKHAELVGTVQISAPAEGLGSTAISGALAAQLIDELPVLAAIAPYTSGGIRIRDAKELRVKESDRIALVAKNLRAMGAEVEEFEDGLDVPGGQTAARRHHRLGRRSSHRHGLQRGCTAGRGRDADSGRGVGSHQLPGVFRSAGSGRGAVERKPSLLQLNKKARRLPGLMPRSIAAGRLRRRPAGCSGAAGGVMVGSLPGLAGITPGTTGAVVTCPVAASGRLIP